jgi:hypothetical protein
VTVAPTQPPQTPVIVYSVAGTTAGTVTCTQSNGTVRATNTATPVAACAAALNTAGVAPSTLVTLYAPSNTPLWNGELVDMMLVVGQ